MSDNRNITQDPVTAIIFHAVSGKFDKKSAQHILYAMSAKSDTDNIFYAVSRKFENILQAVTAKLPIRLQNG